MTQDTGHAIRIDGLVKRFRKFQLGPLQMNVPTGTVYGLIGPNGAGKTTTIDLIMGMGEGEAGTITVFGLDHRRDEVEVKLRTGYVSPELSLAAWRTVGRALRFLRQFYPTWDDEYCARLLKRFELAEDDSIAALSLGNRTRLNLVAALSHRPELLLLDEPITGLDAVAKAQFFREMLSLMQEERSTVVISSHNLSDLERFCDRIGIIHRGKMLLEGATSGLIERFSMVDVRVADGWQPRAASGLRVVQRDGDRWRLLVDRESAGAAEAEAQEVLSRTPLTLEELFVALVGEEAAG